MATQSVPAPCAKNAYGERDREEPPLTTELQVVPEERVEQGTEDQDNNERSPQPARNGQSTRMRAP